MRNLSESEIIKRLKWASPSECDKLVCLFIKLKKQRRKK